jgi:signal peptidase II
VKRAISRMILVVAVLFSTIGCDQTTKYAARSMLEHGGTRKVVGDFFVLIYAENRGAFLSLGSNIPDRLRAVLLWFLPLAAVVGASVYLFVQRKLTIAQTLGLAIFIGGGIGNLIDRFARNGYVTDFMNLGIGRFRIGIFNFADLFLSQPSNRPALPLPEPLRAEKSSPPPLPPPFTSENPDLPARLPPEYHPPMEEK